MAGKFYAVKKGKVPGIYTSWDEMCIRDRNRHMENEAVSKNFIEQIIEKDLADIRLAPVENGFLPSHNVPLPGPFQ